MVFNTRHLDPDHWNNLDARYRNWSEYNGSIENIRQREKITQTIITIIRTEILPELTSRQTQIVIEYFSMNGDSLCKSLNRERERVFRINELL